MLLLLSVVLGIFFGLLRKGKLFHLVSLRALWLAIVPMLSVILIKYFPQMSYLSKAFVITISYLCTFGFAFFNRKQLAPALFLGLGTVLNYLVIAINGFRMPITARALLIYPTMTAEAVAAQRADYFVAIDGAKLMFLGDVIYFPIKPFDGFLSVGDILLAIGMFWLIVKVMGKSGSKNNKDQIKI